MFPRKARKTFIPVVKNRWEASPRIYANALSALADAGSWFRQAEWFANADTIREYA